MKAAAVSKRLIDAKIKYKSVDGYAGFTAFETYPKCSFDSPVLFLNDGRFSSAIYKGNSLSLSEGIEQAKMCAKKFE